MSPKQLQQRLEQARRKLMVYKTQWPRKAGIKALEWVDGNFKAQGYRDGTLIPWRRTKSGKKVKFGQRSAILIEQGKLRRGMRMREGKERVRIYNNVPYARIHNEGFKGTQQVRAHNRRNKLIGTIKGLDDNEYAYGARMSLRTRRKVKNAKVTQDVKVKAFTRNMNMPRRQFMPSATRGSKMLNKEIREMTEKDISKILQIVR